MQSVTPVGLDIAKSVFQFSCRGTGRTYSSLTLLP